MAEEIRVPGGEGCSVRLARGTTLTVVNVHGTQVVDTWAFPLDAMPADSRRLYDLAKSMMEIAITVERGRSAVGWRFDVFRLRPMHEDWS